MMNQAVHSPLPLEDVFEKAGVPRHTFVQPIDYTPLSVALRNPRMSVIVEGPSGIGKTTLIRKVLEDLGAPHLFLRARRQKDHSTIGQIEHLRFKGNTPKGTVVIDDFHLL